MYCGPVPQIDNGFSIGASNVTYKGVAYYQCYAGFGFSSGQRSEKISCLADGRWEKLPTCQGKIVFNFYYSRNAINIVVNYVLFVFTCTFSFAMPTIIRNTSRQCNYFKRWRS